VFRRFQREEQQADWLERSYSTKEEDPESYDEEDEPDEDADFGSGDAGDDLEPDEPGGLGSGPWDGAERYPAGNRVDFGSLLVPVLDGLEIRINLADAVTGVSVDVVRGDMLHGGSFLQLQAFAAPKSSGLWDEVRQEIADEVVKSGGRSEEVSGPYGTELRAMVSAAEAGGRQQLEPQRFLGVDGPRWFLRGVIRGAAASRPDQARQLEDLFADVVVVRGDLPVPPRELLPLQLPEDARKALAEQLEQQEQAGPAGANPFGGGPGASGPR